MRYSFEFKQRPKVTDVSQRPTTLISLFSGQRPARETLRRFGLAALALSTALLLTTACLESSDEGANRHTQTQALSHPGPWFIPADTLAIGNTQTVAYDGAGAWNGGAGCAGGMTAGAIALRDYLNANFDAISGIGGYSCRQNTANLSQLSVHGTGRALDIFVPLSGGDADNDLGDPVGNWLIEHSQDIGVQYIIWDRWRWSSARPAGSKSAAYTGPVPHIDHLHVELTLAASRRQTAFFQGPMTPPEPDPPPVVAECEPTTPFAPTFCDDDGHWAEAAINFIESVGITNGCGTLNGKPIFCPQDDALRAQVIVMLGNATHIPLTNNPQVFTDMAGFDYATPYANAALAYGITTGCGGTGVTFCPGDSATRSQVAAFIVRAYALVPATKDHFDDDNGDLFEDANNRLAEAGVTQGCRPREFCGNANLTRAELAVFMARAYQLGLPPNWVEPPPELDPVDTDPVDVDPAPAPDAVESPEDLSPPGDVNAGDTSLVDSAADGTADGTIDGSGEDLANPDATELDETRTSGEVDDACGCSLSSGRGESSRGRRQGPLLVVLSWFVVAVRRATAHQP